jgi:hypothetical protein
VQADLAAVDAVTVEQVAEVLSRYPLSESTTLAIGPLLHLQSPA